MTIRSLASACAPAASAVLTLALVAACGAVSASGPGAGSPTPSSSPAATLVVAGDADNGKTVNLHVGDRVEVKLASTYWNLAGSSNPGVLEAVRPPAVSPSPIGCVPGAGCGVVTELFAAIAPGGAIVSASRTSCGEAMRCTGANGSYSISVVVTR
jgi:hypothetical protein